MQLERLTIRNFRGIRDEFVLEPAGDNLALVGPNGSGKSSIIAAIDFLLTGKVSALSGEGTQSITEKQHGRHIDTDSSDTFVTGEYSHEGDSITVTRTLANRTTVETETTVEDGDDTHLEESFENLCLAADRGLHLLSRNEILEFIRAKNQTRSQRLRTLLNLNHIKDRRLALKNALQAADDKARSFEREQGSKQAALFQLLDVDEASGSGLLKQVNVLRTDLAGEELDELRDTDFRQGIQSPVERVSFSPLLTSDSKRLVETLLGWFDEGVEEFLQADEAFRQKWNELDADPETLRALEQFQLLERGRAAIDPDAERCPLCLKPWDPEDLQEHLDQRMAEAAQFQRQKDVLASHRSTAQQLLTDVRIAGKSMVEVLSPIDEFDESPLHDFLEVIVGWEDAYDGELLDEPPHHELTAEERGSLLLPNELKELLEEIWTHIEEQPELEELQAKWEDLGDANTRYDELLTAREHGAEYREIADTLETVHDSFITARDTVLNHVYGEIESRFVEYYTRLHRDESSFSMDLSPTETGLNLEVDFHDRGTHPPHALHSEGHQDSMGLCLHFALCDWLHEHRQLPVLMLDDVVMSVDASHRRPLADLLADDLSDRYQLFITTHDDLWHRHLRSAGVVTTDNSIQFTGWSIEEGPQTSSHPETGWESIYEILEEGDVPAAAHRTRRMAEWFLRESCHSLEAKVTFKAEGRWTLGDFKDGAHSQYLKLVRRAKVAEDSWGRETDDLEELEEKAVELKGRVDSDGAALNPNVHFNEDEDPWAGCTPDELRLAVDAYRDLYRLLWCEGCESCLSLAKTNGNATAVQCRCGEMDLNLRKK